jgi:hypothetical protein
VGDYLRVASERPLSEPQWLSDNLHSVETPLNASSTTAGTLFSGYRFAVPQYQREYAWDRDDVEEFWRDLRGGLEDESYFLGLVILTGTGTRKDVVDGQQRLLTLTLLAAALFHEAVIADRRALADRLQSTFLRSIDFDSDEELPRIILSGEEDSKTLDAILMEPASALRSRDVTDDMSKQLLAAYRSLSENLSKDLAPDPFKRLGIWADFLTNRLYLANFVHPDPASAYRVFEVVNTRGKELTTADLLKSFVLSQTSETARADRYEQWKSISGQFPADNPNLFVQFIRHAVTTRVGHVLPKDLYDVLATGSSNRRRMGPDELMVLMGDLLPLYLQMIDPLVDGPANSSQLDIFSVLNRLSVISVRPMLLAIAETDDADDGMRELLKLVVRRVVVGTLGTGNVERRFGQAAQRISDERTWKGALGALGDLNPQRDEFVRQLHRRSLNKNVLTVLRQSIIQRTVMPAPIGYLHLIMPRQTLWSGFSVDTASYWLSTIGNTMLARESRRPAGSSTWQGFHEYLLPLAVEGEWKDQIEQESRWDEDVVSSIGEELAEVAATVWFN